jgi:ABC-type multidrug transport system fused ATPase/permease subunit
MSDFLSRFFYIMAGKKRYLLFLAILFLFVSLIEVVGIGLVGPFIAIATNQNLIYKNPQLNWLYAQLGFHSEIPFISFIGLGIVGILAFKAVIGFNVQRYIFNFGFSQQASLRSRLMSAYLRVPYVFHLSRNTAVVVQNILNETTAFANGVLMPILFSLANFTIICALIILLAKTDLTATLTVLGVLLLAASFMYQYKDKVAQWGKEASMASTETIRIINHGMGGLKEVRIIGCESYLEHQMDEQADRLKDTQTKINTFSLIPRYVFELFLVTFLVGFIIVSLNLGRTTQTISATLGVFAMASIRLMPAVSNLLGSIGGIKASSYSVDKLYLDLKELENAENYNNNCIQSLIKNEINSDSSYCNRDIISFKYQIKLERITYKYPDVSDYALKEISLVINKGESIGLIGKSGAGKTTLVDVILGLLLPESGDITVDGISVGSNMRPWQNLLGYIPQSIFLMDDTMERNIAFGVPDNQIDRQRLDNAIQSAQLTELIDRLPDAIKTVVGERGVRLSGGQRQRVGIARALYHESEILVLDEATAALDNETESLVTEAIQSLSGQKTMIIIAHRLSTLEHCDRVYMIDKGQIVKSGSYQDVVLEEAAS